jgi:hypothetical protein
VKLNLCREIGEGKGYHTWAEQPYRLGVDEVVSEFGREEPSSLDEGAWDDVKID